MYAHLRPALFLQDVLVVTAPGSGAEIIPFLKTWVNLPMAIGFTILYAKVSQLEAGSCCTAPAQLQQQQQPQPTAAPS